MWPDVSEERVTSTFRVANEWSMKTAYSGWLSALSNGPYRATQLYPRNGVTIFPSLLVSFRACKVDVCLWLLCLSPSAQCPDICSQRQVSVNGAIFHAWLRSPAQCLRQCYRSYGNLLRCGQGSRLGGTWLTLILNLFKVYWATNTPHWNPFGAEQRTAPSFRAAAWYRFCETTQRTWPRAVDKLHNVSVSASGLRASNGCADVCKAGEDSVVVWRPRSTSARIIDDRTESRTENSRMQIKKSPLEPTYMIQNFTVMEE
jgi:hypothetical protein